MTEEKEMPTLKQRPIAIHPAEIQVKRRRSIPMQAASIRINKHILWWDLIFSYLCP